MGYAVKTGVTPTYLYFGKLLNSCDIIFSIDALALLPFESNQAYARAPQAG
jgi:hypothetical protein